MLIKVSFDEHGGAGPDRQHALTDINITGVDGSVARALV
jgi:hypothetical protein